MFARMLTFAIVSMVCGTVLASDCHQFVVREKVFASNLIATPIVVSVPVQSYAVPIQQYGSQHYTSALNHYAIRQAVRQAIAEVQAQQLQAPAVAQPQKQPEPAQVQAQPSDGADSSAIRQMFTQRCVSCHGARKEVSGGFHLVWRDESGQLRWKTLTPEQRKSIFFEVSTGSMPKEAQTDESKAIDQNLLPALAEWVRSGDTPPSPTPAVKSGGY